MSIVFFVETILQCAAHSCELGDLMELMSKFKSVWHVCATSLQTKKNVSLHYYGCERNQIGVFYFVMFFRTNLVHTK